MCDWEERDYAEYLLWVEAARAQVPIRLRELAAEPEISRRVPEPDRLVESEA